MESDRNRVGVRLADVRWGGANLAGIDWARVGILGDEREAAETTKSMWKRQWNQIGIGLEFGWPMCDGVEPTWLVSTGPGLASLATSVKQRRLLSQCGSDNGIRSE